MALNRFEMLDPGALGRKTLGAKLWEAELCMAIEMMGVREILQDKTLRARQVRGENLATNSECLAWETRPGRQARGVAVLGEPTSGAKLGKQFGGLSLGGQACGPSLGGMEGHLNHSRIFARPTAQQRDRFRATNHCSN